MYDVPCECGHVNRVECKPPRFQNLPQTSIIVLEHCGPSICGGCMRQVVLCAVSAQTIVLRLLPVKPVEEPVPAAAAPGADDDEPPAEEPPPVVN
jgi:hypothetical protein